jgi:histidinol-phosphatase (PHP family)
MKTSYHVHTRWSDGGEKIPAYVRAAGEMGLDELGFSDHYVLHPSGDQIRWGIPLNKLPRYVAEVRAAAQKSPEGLTIRLGIEMDYFPEQEDAIRKVLGEYPFDYVIGSVHFFHEFPIDEAAEIWERIAQSERDEIIRGYWVRMKRMAESGLFDVAGHLDLTKKFGYRPSTEPAEEISAALGAIAEKGMVVELNTAGWHVPVGEQYPSEDILRECFERGIPVIVAADAHKPENLTRDYPRAYALLRQIGFTELALFAERRQTGRRL